MKPSEYVRAWDLPTRIFHWSLVIVIASGWASYEFSEAIGDHTMKWHRYNGYVAIILIVWRVLWGLVGSSTSRFANFLTWPWTALSYGMDLLRGRKRPFLGHNPLGTYMILALLVGVTIQTMLGLFATEHNFLTWGPLSHLISSDLSKQIAHWHHEFFDVLLVLIAAHVIANIVYAVVKKDPLIKAMVTGKKPAANYEDMAEARVVGWPIVRAIACLVVATGLVFGGILATGGKLFY